MPQQELGKDPPTTQPYLSRGKNLRAVQRQSWIDLHVEVRSGIEAKSMDTENPIYFLYLFASQTAA